MRILKGGFILKNFFTFENWCQKPSRLEFLHMILIHFCILVLMQNLTYACQLALNISRQEVPAVKSVV